MAQVTTNNLPTDYHSTLNQFIERINLLQYRAYKSVNVEKIRMNYDLGEIIDIKTERDNWGSSTVEKLAGDLQAKFPGMKRFSDRNLWRYKYFYNQIFNQYQKLPQPVAEIPFSTIIRILEGIKDIEARDYYLQRASSEGWSRGVAEEAVKNNLYEQNQLQQHNLVQKLEEKELAQIRLNLQGEYDMTFLNLPTSHSERQLEDKIVQNLTRFQTMLGKKFSFVGRQVRLELAGKEYFVDLLFFHRGLQRLVAIELKIGEFEVEYISKMGLYLKLLDEQIKEAHEKPSIGIIICKSQDKTTVEYALSLTDKPMGIATYTHSNLPEELLNQLPNEDAFGDIT